MSPLSDDPEKRETQLANLRPGAGAWQSGEASPNLRHGLRSRRPPALILKDTESEIYRALADQVPLRGPDGDVLPEFTTAIEVAALKLIRVRRALNWLGSVGETDERGKWRPENAMVDRAIEALERSLDRLGATPTSYARLGFDVARTGLSLAEQQALAERERRGDG